MSNTSNVQNSSATPPSRVCRSPLCRLADVTDFSTCRFCGTPYDAVARKLATSSPFDLGQFLRSWKGLIILGIAGFLTYTYVLPVTVDFFQQLVGKKAAATIQAETAKLAADPTNYDALVKRAEAYWTDAYYDPSLSQKALADYTAAIKFHPELPKAYEKRAILYDAAGEPALAARDRLTASQLGKK